MRGKDLIVIGAGGHARVLLDLIRRIGRKAVGILDRDPALKGSAIMGVPVFGGDSELGAYSCDQVELVNAIGSVDSMDPRREVFARMKALGFEFATLTDPSSFLAGDVVLGEGAQVLAGAVLQAGSSVGANSIVNSSVSIDHECIVGAHCHVAPGAVLSGKVRLGDSSHIGAGSTVIQGISIGGRALVAAGAVVTRDVPDGCRVAGVPAKEMKTGKGS